MAEPRDPGADARRRMHLAARAALPLIAHDLLGRAQRRAPIEEGTLRGSGHVEVRTSAVGVTAEVSFNTPYAQYQHERLDLRHDQGSAKYLEGPLKEMAPRYGAALAAAVRRSMRG